MKFLHLIIFIVLCNVSVNAQCTSSIVSSDGYTVDISITPTNIVAPSSCPFGYNFNVGFTYEITFSGTNIPANLYTLQGTLACDSYNAGSFGLPNDGGVGSGVTTGNPYNNNTDCTTATVASLGCTTFNLQIEGPGITNQTIVCEAIVPIELGAFTATRNQNVTIINWETLSEINNDRFMIERSTDAKAWDLLVTVDGVGNSSELVSYEYVDRTPFVGNTYYRLRQQDFDGSQWLSSVIRVISNDKEEFHFYPNPANESLTFKNMTNQVNIYDQLGQLILIIEPHNLDNTTSVYLGDLHSGIYFVENNGSLKRLVIL